VNQQVNVRLAVTRTILWGVLGAGMAVAVVRFLRGLGVTTALTDLTPWGLWVGFDVVSGVALAAGGFVIAATVHVFHLRRYQPVLRPAILTAFLGYVAVVIGLLVDLGRPWNIWRPTVFWQPHSALFEVAWCVMLYLTVLALEFAPVVFEGIGLTRAYRFLKRLTLPLVITGIALSTLHQSSLGTLFVINPGRIHPLWWSPILPLIFFVSAVALGLAMVTLESVVSSWLFHKEAEWPLLAGLGRAASWVLVGYLALRLADLGWRGSLRFALEGSGLAALFLVELTISTVLPILLFTLPSLRQSRRARGWGAALVVGGFVLHRVTVAGIGHTRAAGEVYLPALSELIVSLAVVAGMALVFLFFVENLKVWDEIPPRPDHFRSPTTDPVSRVLVRAPWWGAVQQAAGAWVVGAILGVVILEAGAGHGAAARPDPVVGPGAIGIRRIPNGGGPGVRLVLAGAGDPAPAADVALSTALLLDGNGDGRYVLFEHELHQARLGGASSCERCHHRTVPALRATSCTRCHRDMYAPTDTFNHARHAAAVGGNRSCERCHPAGAAKVRAASEPCVSCHRQDQVRPAPFPVTLALGEGIAPPYRTAVHGLCVDCHRRQEAALSLRDPYLSRCPTCHRGSGDRTELAVRRGWTVAEGRPRP
jgi:Ni/Fe-hydrogenase subunit HybB-like protein